MGLFLGGISGNVVDRWQNRSYDLPMLIWDEAKRRANIAKHGYDFAGIEAILDAPVVSWEDDRDAYGEQRLCLLGWFRGQMVHLTYVDDGEHLRIISLRKAERHEARYYEKYLAR